MDELMRVMTPRPRNAETPRPYLRSWITANKVFFDRNQGEIPETKIDLSEWRLIITGNIDTPFSIDFEYLLSMPKAIVANTLECSGNSRSLLEKKAPGNPWIIGGVGNAVWGGVRLADVLDKAGVLSGAAHVSFEGMDIPLGKAGINLRALNLVDTGAFGQLRHELSTEVRRDHSESDHQNADDDPVQFAPGLRGDGL